MRIVLTGGGTGGHLVPLVAVAKEIKKKIPDTEFVFLGPAHPLEKSFMEPEGIPVRNIMSGKIRRYFSLETIIDLAKVPLGIFQALWKLLVIMPDAIFAKGGYAAVPVVLAGWAYRIPVMIHESDAKPGIANIIMAKFCQRVAISYPEAEKYFPARQVVLTGNPLRPDITQGDPAKAREKFSLIESKKVIFVWGGSQGARYINNKILNILPNLLHKYQIIHQTGEKNIKEVEHKAGEIGIKAGREGYHPVAFIREELKDVLALADLVISRAGANSISEIAANKKPSIIIPIESSANGHQLMNAYSVAKTGGCVVFEENNLGEHMLLEKIDELMEDEELRKKMTESLGHFYHPDAADRIANGILGMIQ
jgi:UDP-N-acetylglucosamine--N-acetylmuramyl-(pentapeptide) pyrophosphoryl-undecaprenol N-acetylglucosamine transferase